MPGVFLGPAMFVGANSQFPDSQILAFAQSQLGTTLSNIAGFSWSLAANTMYGIQGFIDTTKATLTGGSQMSLNYSAGLTSLSQGLVASPTGSQNYRANNSNNTALAIGGTSVIVGAHASAIFSAFIIPSAAGTLRIAASATLAGDILVNPGTWFTVFLPTPVGSPA